MPPQKFENSIFWIDVEKIKPNPYQPRREFDEQALRDLSESIRQYGILQPLTVSRVENWNEDGSFQVTYELVAGERRLRASKLAGLSQVPVIIRTGDDSRTKLELAILENLQREDLNPVDRAKAFARLATEFNQKHVEIAKKIGKSREYVSNTLRLLSLPEEILNAVSQGKISEGHTRPLMMLIDRPEEQASLYKEMLMRKMTVREAENIARRIAVDKIRKKEKFFDPDIAEMEGNLAETLGARVQIEKKDVGGKITIDFFSYEELQSIMNAIRPRDTNLGSGTMANPVVLENIPAEIVVPMTETITESSLPQEEHLVDDRSKEEKVQDEQEEDLYNIKNFTI